MLSADVFVGLRVGRTDKLRNMPEGTMFYLPHDWFQEKVFIDEEGTPFMTKGRSPRPLLDSGYYIKLESREVHVVYENRRVRIECIWDPQNDLVHWVGGNVPVTEIPY